MKKIGDIVYFYELVDSGNICEGKVIYVDSDYVQIRCSDEPQATYYRKLNELIVRYPNFLEKLYEIN